MTIPHPSRRKVLAGAAGLAATLPFSARVLSAAPPATTITPELIAAAKKEGKVNWYSAMDLTMTERMARAFEAVYPGIKVKVERSGAERIFTRIGQEYASNIHNADVVNTTDASHAYVWRNKGWLEPFVTADTAAHFPAEYKNAEGHWATFRIVFAVPGYNKTLVKPEEVPKSYKDLLDARWTSRLVKAHPAYSGACMTATHGIIRTLGWGYLEALAKLKVMQVQSAVDPPKKIQLGERAAMVDGSDYLTFIAIEKGAPLEVVYPLEGSPVVNSPNALFKGAPNPNAARLLLAWMYTPEGQSKLVEITGSYVPHDKVAAKAGRIPLSDIKIIRDDPERLLVEADEIKKRYAELFKV